MIQYIITGTDYKDALERRMAARERHLEGARKFKAEGKLLFAGAFLNDEGQMAGSTMVVQFATEAELHAWLESEPYILERVWESIDVKVIKIPQL